MVLKVGQILSRCRKKYKYNTGALVITSRMSKVEEKDAKKLPEAIFPGMALCEVEQSDQLWEI